MTYNFSSKYIGTYTCVLSRKCNHSNISCSLLQVCFFCRYNLNDFICFIHWVLLIIVLITQLTIIIAYLEYDARTEFCAVQKLTSSLESDRTLPLLTPAGTQNKSRVIQLDYYTFKKYSPHLVLFRVCIQTNNTLVPKK